jgi:hypothetical protein
MVLPPLAQAAQAQLAVGSEIYPLRKRLGNVSQLDGSRGGNCRRRRGAGVRRLWRRQRNQNEISAIVIFQGSQRHRLGFVESFGLRAQHHLDAAGQFRDIHLVRAVLVGEVMVRAVSRGAGLDLKQNHGLFDRDALLAVDHHAFKSGWWSRRFGNGEVVDEDRGDYR